MVEHWNDKYREIIREIEDEVLKREIKIVLKLMQKAISDIEINYESNVIDPFITLFEKIIFSCSDFNSKNFSFA